MLVNQRVSAPWSSPFCWSVSRLHTTGSGSFHSPTLLTGFVGECSFVGEFGVSLEGVISRIRDNFDFDSQYPILSFLFWRIILFHIIRGCILHSISSISAFGKWQCLIKLLK